MWLGENLDSFGAVAFIESDLRFHGHHKRSYSFDYRPVEQQERLCHSFQGGTGCLMRDCQKVRWERVELGIQTYDDATPFLMDQCNQTVSEMGGGSHGDVSL